MKNICYNPTWLIALEHPLERIVRNTLIGCIGMCILVYLYLVGGTVVNLMERKEVSLSSAALAQNVAKLESRYLELSNSVGADTAVALGLIPVQVSGFVYEPGTTAFAAPRAL